MNIRKRAFFPILAAAIVLAAVFWAPAVPTGATAAGGAGQEGTISGETKTDEKLAETGGVIDSLREKSEAAKEKLDAAKREQGEAGRRLDGLNADMEEARQDMEDIQARIDAKNEEILSTREELAEMEARRASGYEEMKARIRFMYEHSDDSPLTILLGARSMSDFLNRMEYFSQVMEYDRNRLDEYGSLLEGLEEKRALYEGQKEELLALRDEQDMRQDELSAMIDEARDDLRAADDAATAASNELDDIDSRLAEQLEYEKALEEQKAAEDKERMDEIRREEEELKRKREEMARKRAEEERKREEERRRQEEERKRQEEERKRQEEEERRRQEELASQGQESGGAVDVSGGDVQDVAGNGAGDGDASGGIWEDDIYGYDSQPSESDVELLACIIQCEADGEPYEGKLAVGSVVMNRVVSDSFPNTVSGVIYQSGQFSPVASGRMAARLVEGANETCRNAARHVLGGNITVPYLYFRTNTGIVDGLVIGNHVFY